MSYHVRMRFICGEVPANVNRGGLAMVGSDLSFAKTGTFIYRFKLPVIKKGEKRETLVLVVLVCYQY